jgi:hypothetical protein
MKKIAIITAIILNSLAANAQSGSPGIKLHAAALGFGGYYFKKNNNEGGGATFLADATFSLGKNLISPSYLVGSDIGILGESSHRFSEPALLYGREWKVVEWFRFEGFAGVGYYNQTSDIPEIPTDKSISFPLRLNTKFYFTKKFGMGLNTNYSINSVNNNFSTNLIFHYRFNQ